MNQLFAKSIDTLLFDLGGVVFNIRMEKILFFDDSWENVSGARSAGMQAVHVTSLSTIKGSLKAIRPDI